MPQYTWKCEKCEEIVEIYAGIHDMETPPIDVLSEGARSCAGHTWKRIIRGVAAFRRGDSWGGKKGEW